MREKTSNIILIIIIIGIVGFAVCQNSCYMHSTKNICTNNATRDYAYEAYCDSIWEADKDYYLDVLVETDEYQLYLEAHGSWWSNDN